MGNCLSHRSPPNIINSNRNLSSNVGNNSYLNQYNNGYKNPPQMVRNNVNSQNTNLGTTSAAWDSHNTNNVINSSKVMLLTNQNETPRSIPSHRSSNTNNTNGRINNLHSNHTNINSNNNIRYTNHNRTPVSHRQNSRSSSQANSQSSSANDRIFVALYDYAARTDADLSFRRGDKMEILDRKSAGGWWMAKHMDPQAILSRGEIKDRGYVPSNFLAKYRSLESYDWYFGPIRRNEAERTLLHAKNITGSFLLRTAETRAGEYSLSLRDGIKVKHYRIRTKDEGGYFIAQTTVFNTLPDLIIHYSEIADGLCCRLTRPSCKVEMMPVTQGLSHDTVEQYEVPAKSFEKIKKLGGGNFGDVYEGIWNGSTRVAIKCLKGEKIKPDEFMNEAEHMRALHHDRLLPLYAVVRSPDDKIYWIITELMSNGSLLSYLKDNPKSKHLTIETLVDVSTQVADGMSYIESQNYVHRDLAARNVLVGENNKIKVGDFGLARVLEHSDMYTAKEGAKIPIKWTAPEAVMFSRFTIKSDVWSFGILLTEIVTRGRTPYPGMTNNEVLDHVYEKSYRMPQTPDCPDALYTIMTECWHKKPEKRPSFDNLKGRLEELFDRDDDYREADTR